MLNSSGELHNTRTFQNISNLYNAKENKKHTSVVQSSDLTNDFGIVDAWVLVYVLMGESHEIYQLSYEIPLYVSWISIGFSNFENFFIF
jgi:hypothetical protein